MKDFGDEGTQLKWIGRQRTWTSMVWTVGVTMVLVAVLARWTGLAGYNVKAGYTATLVADG